MWNLLVQDYIFIRISDIKSDILFVLEMEISHTYIRSVTLITCKSQYKNVGFKLVQKSRTEC